MIFKTFLRPVTKRHVERKILSTSPSHLYSIIVDVDEYSKFLPLCTHSKILHGSNDERSFEASLTVGMPPVFTETYVSSVVADPQKLVVETRSIQSKLFDSLTSRWKLFAVPESEVQCKVDFEVSITASVRKRIGNACLLPIVSMMFLTFYAFLCR